ncbi:acyl-CoA thioesterase [Micromonospora sp. CA-240977]|uniref:acyl-CoA thioesterase n=1 Tax=Micromonospora sp. CA-240977 TaxID=3239957 RepID=UPI003D8BDEB6
MTFDGSSISYGELVPVRVFFDDLDSLGMLHHSRFITLLDRGVNEFWATRGYLVTASADAGDALNVVRALTISYDQPVAQMGEILLWLWVKHVGKTSVTYGFRFISLDGTAVYAEGTRTNVRIDPVTKRPTEWSDAARADAEELMGPEGSDSPTLQSPPA